MIVPTSEDKEKHKSKVNAVGMRYLRNVCGKTCMDKVSNEWELKECGLKGNPTGNHCIPAGSDILNTTQMVCPKHYKPKRKGIHHVNVSWCSICTEGGSLMCCDICPNSFHAHCLVMPVPEGGYTCEDCQTGRFPLYGEVVWVKLGAYR
ncbi:unnamed protein product [Timema podura]|uniref:Zinc finger PHD-type domain-containing protein n=1 Tax=Timema podura TaxID=61482 RepID=A0ABN7PA10_TIMPD|nr:unnamed protein product [Timema podura]